MHFLKSRLEYWVILIALMPFVACEKYKAEIPSYLQIDQITVTSDALTQGTNSSNITDAWVYLNDNLVGVFELPATIPVIGDGENKLTIKAGIKVSGISGNRDYYPFYTSYETSLNLIPDSTFTIYPTVTYQSWTDFSLIEEFNYSTSIVTFDTTSYSEVPFQTTTDPSYVFEGDGSAVIYLDNTNDYFECYTSQSYELPQGGNPVYIEMNYKSDAYIGVGIVGIEGSSLIKVYESVILNPSAEWNKIYINLTNEVSAYTQTSEFKLYIAAENLDSLSTAAVYIDNFKVVH